MKTLSVRKSFERLDVEVGGEVVRCVIDCTDTKVNSIAAKCMAARDRAAELDAERAATADLSELDALSREMAGVIGPVVTDAIGEDSYRAILTACGDGVELAPEQANLVMVQVFATVCQAVVERLADVKQGKAAHYLQEVTADAAAQPDRA